MNQAISVKVGFISGLAAATIVVAVASLVALLLGVATTPELLWDSVIGAIPGPIFSATLDRLQFAGKPLLFAGIVGLELLAAGFLGVIYALAVKADTPRRRLARHRPRITGLMYGAAVSVLLLASEGPLLNAKGWPAGAIAILSLLAFSMLQAEFSARWDRRSPNNAGTAATFDRHRRDLLIKGLIGFAALAVSSTWLWNIFGTKQGQPGRTGSPSLSKPTSYITPNTEFYKVSKNFRDPEVDAKAWSLEIKGLVSNPLRLTLADLKALPSVTRTITLECISNEVGGGLMGNAVWQGVLLRDLLLRAGVSPQALDVQLGAADDYTDSIPLERAMNQATMIAYEMNGETLSPAHGYPVRLLVPGIYGMKNVKWIKTIELVPKDYYGYWEQQGWSDSAIIRTMSRVDSPNYGDPLGPQATVFGVAFAGDRGISRIEVSFDSSSWQQATILQADSLFSWVLWSLEAIFPGDGLQDIYVRAVDGQGVPQMADNEESFPSGATGYHHVFVKVRS
ncbi:MAG: molybdopterin-dependent oxidoreductase [Dehalococcoidia bacterium]|nr:molybdopterin-dependent oxidoreductase [Dehalococcoidia bacterium]